MLRYVGGVLLLVGMLSCVSCSSKTVAKPITFKQVGTTFSIPYAKWLSGEWGGPGTGLKWQECLKQICELGFKPIRLTMQWNEVERQEKHYDFKEIDEALAICDKNKVPVVLCLGAKTPRYPEIHIPDFYKTKLGTFEGDLNKGIGRDLRAFLAAALKRYDQDARIECFQIENEPLDPMVGLGLAIPLEFLKQEVTFVRSQTTKMLLVTMGVGLTDATSEEVRRIRLPMVDSLATLKVPKLGFDFYGKGSIGNRTFTATDQHWDVAKQVVDAARRKGMTPFVAELQCEPWESDPKIVDFKNPNGNRSLTPATYRELLQRTADMGFDEVWVWGVEFQLACAKQGNIEWLDVTKPLLKH